MASTLVRNLATPTPNPSPQGGGERRLRRGACPGLSAPMPTGDGLLVRLMPTGTIPLSAFKHLCAAARRHGNGIVEVTGRGSIQVRGLNAASAWRFAEAITALGIAAKDDIAVLEHRACRARPERSLRCESPHGRFASCSDANVTRRKART